MKRFRTTLTVILALVISAGFYLAARLSLAAYYHHQATQQAQANQMTQSYELQQKSLKLNPLSASYQRQYALTNLSLATALTNKTELTPEEEKKLPQLVKQTVRAATRATKLQAKNPTNWQVLGQVYANLLDVIPQADQFAVEAYLKAIKLDQENPKLKLQLSKIFYQNRQFPQAQKLLTQITETHPDSAEAHYYLANTYHQQGQLEAAIASYQTLLTLLEPKTEAFKTAQTELESTLQLQSESPR